LDIERITAAHADAAVRAIEAGFDAVEIHLGHSYLASAFLSPKINHRKDEYGGPLANRAKFARGILRAVRDAVGDRIAILTKLNMSDGVRGGISVEEAIQTAQWIEADGTVDGFEMTAGSSLLNPMYLFRGGAPVGEFVGVMPQPVRTAMRLAGRRFIREYPYRDAYLLENAREVRREIRTPMVLLGGITDRNSMDLAMDEGFEFVAMARALLREPDLVNRIATDAATPSLCIHCNRCMPTNFVGTHCPVIADGSSRSATWGTPAGYA
jgi:2,4-dienoyl-CoA reductase-like NADH-dependent reductase (Old Yellow Enzyme family)